MIVSRPVDAPEVLNNIRTAIFCLRLGFQGRDEGGAELAKISRCSGHDGGR